MILLPLNTRLYGTVFDLDDIVTTIADIEIQMQDPIFWNDHENASNLSKNLNDAKEQSEFWQQFETQLHDYNTLSDGDLEIMADEIHTFIKNFNTHYTSIFLSGPHDNSDALMHIHAGAGGVDAQDWASILIEMYRKYCEKHNFDFRVLNQTFGEQNGIKNATIEITGKRVFGMLKHESGVHRLVRKSPFNASGLRHTSFAMIELLPEIKNKNLIIDEQDLRIDTFKSSGPGGQNVNKLETAVRITHVPTNTIASVQSERSQAQNKQKAMLLIHSKLTQLMQKHQAQELEELRGKIKDQKIEWGNQIRSYVLHPYQLVKDHRTNIETNDVESVLNGIIDIFIEAQTAQL